MYIRREGRGGPGTGADGGAAGRAQLRPDTRPQSAAVTTWCERGAALGLRHGGRPASEFVRVFAASFVVVAPAVAAKPSCLGPSRNWRRRS